MIRPADNPLTLAVEMANLSDDTVMVVRATHTGLPTDKRVFYVGRCIRARLNLTLPAPQPEGFAQRADFDERRICWWCSKRIREHP